MTNITGRTETRCLRCGGIAEQIRQPTTAETYFTRYRCLSCGEIQQWIPNYDSGSTGGNWLLESNQRKGE